jgi:ribonuclease BN (tRNA processing enzyme)
MKITFVGTSHGRPQKDRYCSCYMIEIGKAIYFVDAGAPMVTELLKREKHPNNVKAIFTTHIHGDHTGGIKEFSELCVWAYKEADVDILLTEQKLIDTMKAFICATLPSTSFPDERIRFKLANEGKCYEDENLKVTFIRTQHMSPEHPTYAILIEAEGKKVLFGGDFSIRLEKNDFPKIVSEQPLDLFICEMAHFGMEQLKPYLDTCKAKRVAFTHVFPLDKYGDIEKLKSNYTFETLAPFDGNEIVL